MENPSLSFLSAYSTTTIAPSTSKPTDSMSANKTTMFIVKPIIERASRPDKKDPGIDKPTKSPDLTPNAPSIIIKTNIIAAITLFWRLFNIVLMPLDWSWLYNTLIFGGKSEEITDTTLLTSSTVWIIFSPILLETWIVIEFEPLTLAYVCLSSNVLLMLAISLKVITESP